MHKLYFLLLGNDRFGAFVNVFTDDESIMKNEKNSGKLFNSLKINNKKHVLKDIFLGWSCSVFQVDRKLYLCGFLNNSCCDNAVEIKFPTENNFDVSCGLDTIYCASKSKIHYISSRILKLQEITLKERNVVIKNVASCDIYSIVLTLDGKVFLFTLSDDDPVIPLQLPQIITKVSAGKEHIIMLSDTGQVFSYGYGSHGQLGHGDIANQDTPLLLEALDGIRIISIDAGGWHSAALSCDGDLYMWGWNESGQLGFPCKELRTDGVPLEEIETICCLPKHVSFDNDIKVVSVSCGSRHSAALTENGCLWTWGWNGYGQLGHENCKLIDKPTLVQLPTGFIPRSLSCRFWNTLVSGNFDENSTVTSKTHSKE